MQAVFLAGTDSFLQFFTVLLVFILVMALTLLTTKWIAGYQKNQMKCKNIEVIESCRVGQNKFVEIVKIGDTYMAIGIGKDEVTMLTEIKAESLNLKENASEIVRFKDSFEKAKNLFRKEE